MVARINTSKNISRALNYNEQKVQQQHAQILHAQNFLKDTDRLNFYDKLHYLEKLLSLNERVSANTLHVSLNFDPAEKDLSDETLIAIAKKYMTGIGFSEQPYLVYRHHDSGHPHIHIVSVNIQRDGSRISMHNIGRNESEAARKEIEFDFNLVKADSKKILEAIKIIPLSAQKVQYGKLATKHAISNVLAQVLHQYKYSSLPELNAILKLYNVVAEKGKGICFRVLDEKGNKTGAPIKASAFHLRPTITFLDKKFAENELLKQPLGKRIKTAVDYALLKDKKPSLENLIASLRKDSMSVVLRQNEEGSIYGITYVDHKTKCVFNGSDLGKSYSASQVMARCVPGSKQALVPADEKKKSLQPEIHWKEASGLSSQSTDIKLPDILLPASGTYSYVPFQFRKKKKRKRKQIKL